MPDLSTPLNDLSVEGPKLSLPRLILSVSGPIALALASWIYLALMIGDMSRIPGMASMAMQPMFAPVQLFGLFLMWTVMMAAMMLPTAMPMIMAFARMQTLDHNRASLLLSASIFSGGYVVSWAVFSVGATLLHAGLSDLAYLSPMMMKIISGPVAGGILVLAGIYQFTPLKQACLRQCRTPISFLMTQWRDGNLGAFVMGWRHGLFCVGCCWALMGLLFVTGVMNTLWIIAITAYVLIEKVVPYSPIISRLIGAGMIIMGVRIFIA